VISLTVQGSGDLRELSERLRRAPIKLRSELFRAFKAAGKPTLRRVKHNIESMDIKGYRAGGRPFTAKQPGTGIRRRISAATKLDIYTGSADPRVKFVVESNRLGDAKNLPFHLDSAKRFRHPVMGNRSKWAANSGKPWFYNEIRKDLDLFKAECEKAIDNTIRQIEAG